MTDLLAALDHITGPARPTPPTRCKHNRHPDHCGHCDALIHHAEEHRIFNNYNRGDQ